MEINRDGEYKKTLTKLRKIFKDIDKDKKQMVDNILEDYVFLYVDSLILKEVIKVSGSVIIEVNGNQKKSEATMQYQRNSNTMNMHTRTLMIMLRGQNPNEEDAIDKFLKGNK
jgi:hypothetical protein